MPDYSADGYRMRDTPIPDAVLSEEVARRWRDEILSGDYSRGIGLEVFDQGDEIGYTEEDVGYFHPSDEVLWVFFRIIDEPARLDWEEDEEDDYSFFVDTDQDRLTGFYSGKLADKPEGDNDYL